MRKLPSLNAVRAFEAAARHGSFARAADELGVSHAAVSRHVRLLEAELGVALFERHARHVVLTGEGALFARSAADSLSGLELGSGRLRRGGGRGTVVLDMESDLAVAWLMPMLDAATLDALDVNLDLRVRPDPPRAVLGDVDLAVTWGAVACTGFRARPFLEIDAFAVAAPALLARGPDPSVPDFFAAHRLIHERGLYWWRSYLARLGRDTDTAAGHLFFNRSHLCIDAARRGLGLAIGDALICRADLAAGRLVRLPGPTLPGRDRYYLLTPETAALSRPVQRVRDWLLAMAAGPPAA
ncbi:LysR substrate-binding domain-containing protein [Aquibium sp. A9E412]|uniref:LysR substrate-binding domain-containing protein n=1 Tax=Aquibium sp. A9E412 TaxID=2976767 RepID=UPI0025B0AA2D|nr:LysR substrate-binding domain-containing protein [Aquibium sp. A9E412]MDN2567239.1 LysR substrate-binding domain-containing protein [Aquibium sp. A9E412]